MASKEMQVSLQVGRLRAFHALLKARHARALDLYTNGGKHSADIAAAHIYTDLHTLLSALFPELGE